MENVKGKMGLDSTKSVVESLIIAKIKSLCTQLCVLCALFFVPFVVKMMEINSPKSEVRSRKIKRKSIMHKTGSIRIDVLKHRRYPTEITL